MLLRIGEFSKLTNVPIRTLRYYDEINLFIPITIDLFTGYRYYSEEQIEDLKLINKLKKLGFSLEEIKTNWNNFTDELMIKKQQELKEKQKNINENIKEIDYLRSNIVDGKIMTKNKKKKEKVKTLF